MAKRTSQRILLMTSTIAPAAGVHALKRVDPLERLSDYQRALGFYLELLARGDIDSIVYVDNSGYDLGSLRALVARAGLQQGVEFISYRSDVPPQHNRLYLEGHLIEHFLCTSKKLKANPGATVWKVTGRYIVRNFGRIVRHCEANGDQDVSLNFRNYPYRVVDFYLVGFKVPAYRRLIGERLEEFKGLEDGEKTLRRILDDAQGMKILRRLPVPRLEGTRGWDGSPYGGPVDSLKYYVRAAGAILMPSVWI
jgi:hypothetical protein